MRYVSGYQNLVAASLATSIVCFTRHFCSTYALAIMSESGTDILESLIVVQHILSTGFKAVN